MRRPPHPAVPRPVREGKAPARGPVDEVLAGELLGARFGLPLAVERYAVRSAGRVPAPP
ncbi:hypothetical protein [Streptomyces sp. TLI_105]|uniref:hypothetical protein n=1 Tax=Streptomyces sp. TLI_105 TaxID=1881019 RepID=UPI0015A53918|nr:hypothetical protein [Streptomyces sp. TLI_105]